MERGITGSLFGIEARLPPPDDEFYLVATHAYSHLNVRRIELENCRRLYVDPLFDVRRVEKLAARYGTEQAVAIFCEILDIDTKLECSDYTNRWLAEAGTIDVNAEVPKSFIPRSSFNHIRSLLRKASLREFVADVAWHLIRPVTKLAGVR